MNEPAASIPSYKIQALAPHHDRATFSCGITPLDLYIQRQARQDVERNLAAVFILTPDGITIAGFYTLSAYSIQALELPEMYARKLPRLPLPVTLLGRMAVSRSLHGQRLGSSLLIHALKQALSGSKQIASWGVIVDAKEGAGAFYRKHEFLPLPDQPDRLFLPMQTIEKSFAP